MTKLLIVLSYLDFPYYSGLSKRIEGLTNTLHSNGVKTIIISPMFRLDHPINYGGNAIRVDLRKMRRLSIYSKLVNFIVLIFFTFNAFIRILRLKLQLRDDLRVIQYESMYSFLPALFAKYFLGVRIIGDDIIFSISRSIRHRLLQKFVVRYTDYIVVSNLTAYNLLKKTGSNRQEVLYVPNGIKSKDVVDYSGKEYKKIVFVGALSYEENVEAVKNLITLSNTLVSSGEEHEISVIGGPLQKIKFEGINEGSGRLRFTGLIEANRYEKILESAYIGVLPFFEKRELGGQRIKALEYFSHGLLVISTPEGVRGIQGLTAGKHYIKVANKDELRDTVRKVLENPTSYLKIANSGRKTVTESYQWEKITQPYIELMELIFDKINQL